MATIWIIAFVLGLIAVCVSLWVAFWVVLFVVEFVKFGHRDLAYRRAEKHHPGIYARFQRTLALREAKRKEKEAYEKWKRRCMPLSNEENNKQVPTALLLHGLLLLAYSEKVVIFLFSP